MSGQPWVCGSCRSINQPREGRCYRCRTPRELVEADPATLLVAGAGSKPTETSRPTGTFRSSADRAFLTQLLIGAALAVTVLGNILGADVLTRVLDGEVVAGDTAVSIVGLVGGLGLLVGAAALVAWALWLNRVVANVPTLGLGWPNVTPTAAIYESVFPGVNLWRVPAILRDITGRLEPGGRGDALIAAAWLGLVGGVLLPRVSSWIIVFIAGTLEAFVMLRVIAGQLGLGLTVAGGILLIVLIQWIETRMERLAAGTRAPEPAREPQAGSSRAAATEVARGETAPPAPAVAANPTPRPFSSPSAHWTQAAGRATPGASATPAPEASFPAETDRLPETPPAAANP